MVTERIVPFKIKNLPNHFNPFTQKGFAIYVLNDYAVHPMPEIRKTLYEKGYILILMGVGITGFIQANDTDLHNRLKALYCEEEMNLMVKMLEADKSKIPSPNRQNMIKMLVSSWDAITTDFSQVFKKLFVTNNLDGSEDYLVSDKLFSIIGREMKDFRDTLIKSDVPNNLQGVVKQLIPPKGIKRNFEEGSEFLEYMDNLDNDEDQSNGSDKSDEEIYKSDDDESEFANEEMNECANEEIAQGSKNIPRSTKIKSLVDISSDPLVNKDARFLEQIQSLLLENDTSDVFKSNIKKMLAAHFDARKSVKKRISDKTGKDIVMEDNENIFEPLKDM